MPGRILVAATLVLSLSVSVVPSHAAPPQDLQSGIDGCRAAKIAFANHPSQYTSSAASSNFDATFYHLDLNIGMVNDSIVGVVRVEGRVTGSALSQLVLDLSPAMHVTSVAAAGGGALVFSHPLNSPALSITLPGSQPVGTLVAVDIRYRGIPISSDFGNFVFGSRCRNNVSPCPGNDMRFAWSLSEPYGSREWWPCKDHPSDKADSVRVTVTVPSVYRVGSQGRLVGETVNGANTTYDWLSHWPIASYLVSVSIGEYVRYQDTYDRPAALEGLYGPLSLPLDYLVYNDITHDLPGSPEGWVLTADALEVEEGWFGPYPFATEKYGHSEVTFGGGMEHQTMSSIGGGSTGVVAHELAHQWYGDKITPQRWTHLWLSEGFASYAEILYFEARKAQFPGRYEAVSDGQYRSARRATGTLVLQDTTNVNDMFDGYRVYAKGSMVLYMLRYMVGDNLFKQIMQTYAVDPAVQYGNAVTEDFQRVAEQVSGLDLDAFFSQWVTTGTGYPRYAAATSWKDVGGGNYEVKVTLQQQQTSSQSNVSVFKMPVDIVVYDMLPSDSLVEIHRETVQNNLRSQTFTFTVAQAPFQVLVDPDKKILRSDNVVALAANVPAYPAISLLSPVPTKGGLTVQYTVDRDGPVDVHVYDIAGKRVLTRRTTAEKGLQSFDLDTGTLASGVYFLRLSSAQGSSHRKFVVLR